ncbi:MAG: sugar O-acetyltransferase [Succinivibrio sp.]|nr:sugar O-acetyltransferase [Succinivibrio sp.]
MSEQTEDLFVKMRQGLTVDIRDPDYQALAQAEFERSFNLCYELNQLRPTDQAGIDEKIRQLFARVGQRVMVRAPLQVDVGRCVEIGSNVFFNLGVNLMSMGGIFIGSGVMVGPHVDLITIDHDLGNLIKIKASAIYIEDNVWIGAKATVLAGVTLHEGCVIGAGSVVTHDMPAHTLCFGNPCRPIRKLERDRDAVELSFL